MEPEVRERLLRILEQCGKEGIGQGELVEASGYSKSWVSEVLRELEEAGLVVRVPGPGRSKRVVLSKFLDPSVGRTIRLGLVRASEYLFLPNFISGLKNRGYRVELVVFGNVSEATAALARGEVHLAITPVYTAAVYRALGAPIRAYPGGALGGASLIYRELKGRVLSSRASTMEVATVVARRVASMDFNELRYYRSPEEGVEALLRGDAEAIAIWEPYASHLEARGLRRVRLSELVGKYYCCALARHENLSQAVAEQVGKVWAEALSEVRRGHLAGDPLGVLGIDRSAAEKAVKEYEYTEHIEWGYIKSVLSYASGFLLNETSLRELLEN